MPRAFCWHVSRVGLALILVLTSLFALLSTSRFPATKIVGRFIGYVTCSGHMRGILSVHLIAIHLRFVLLLGREKTIDPNWALFGSRLCFRSPGELSEAVRRGVNVIPETRQS